MKTVAIIPVRGGSKSIPRKNIKLLGGHPLVYWTTKAASDSPGIDEVYVATDDAEIAAIVESFGLAKVKVVGRSAATATDTASTESVMLEVASSLGGGATHIILIQATSPLLEAKDLTAGLQLYAETGADSLLSTVEQKRFIWQTAADGTAAPWNYDPLKRPRRQDFTGYEVENGAFYICTIAGLISSGSRLHGKIVNYSMDPSTFVEIDEPEDWEAVERLLAKRNETIPAAKTAGQYGHIKLVLTDVDGVLTDAGMYYSELGDELKKFNTRDGKGFELLRNEGIQTGIITTENTKLVARRAAKLKLDHLVQGAHDKLPEFEKILQQTGLSASEVAYIGDDLADIPVLKVVGFAACPNDAILEVQACVHYRCQQKGGFGAFREFAEKILS